jgi:hypothetical protein
MVGKKTTAGQRAATGFVMAMVAGISWVSGERRLSVFVLSAVLFALLGVRCSV